MGVITVEEHYCSERVNEKIAAAMERAGNVEAAKRTRAMFGSENPDVTSMGADRIAYMDAHGIDRQVISYVSGMPATLDPKLSISLCREANDEMASNAAAHPGRFSCFAHLPLGDGEAAAAELERTVGELGFVGAMLSGHYQGLPYDNKLYRPIFEKAAELGVPLYLHPGMIDPEITKRYYGGDWSEQFTFQFAGFGVGWHYDVGVQILRLMFAGVFDELPELKVICGHWGELVAYYMYRSDEIARELLPCELKPSDYFKRSVYVNPSGMLYGENMRFCLDTFGPDHILWGEDYPYRKIDNIGSFLDESDLEDDVREKIAHRNAERILNL